MALADAKNNQELRFSPYARPPTLQYDFCVMTPLKTPSKWHVGTNRLYQLTIRMASGRMAKDMLSQRRERDRERGIERERELKRVATCIHVPCRDQWLLGVLVPSRRVPQHGLNIALTWPSSPKGLKELPKIMCTTASLYTSN